MVGQDALELSNLCNDASVLWTVTNYVVAATFLGDEPECSRNAMIFSLAADRSMDRHRQPEPHRLIARGIIKDKAAVCAAITEPWSNGQTEGQITKLKLVKRQMYGRAKIDLLQARLVGATCQADVIGIASEPFFACRFTPS